MKVAVLISGIMKPNPKFPELMTRIIEVNKSMFSEADFYYATWDNEKNRKLFDTYYPEEECHYFNEPKIHYHPYTDVPKEYHISENFKKKIKQFGSKPWFREWTSHHTKQHLIHCFLLDKIEMKYDVIVRMRFDSFIHRKANFLPYVEDAYQTGYAHGFAVTKRSKFNEFYDSPESDKRMKDYMIDQLIIHNAANIDTKEVYKLHEEKRLRAAEFGWYQVLSQPYVGHKNHHGFVNSYLQVNAEHMIEEDKKPLDIKFLEKKD